jgi:predicted dehydrogenase
MRLALVGCGQHMRNVLVPMLRRHQQRFTNVKCVDPDMDAAAAAAQLLPGAQPFKTIEDLDVAELDCVIVAAAPAAHASILDQLVDEVPRIFVEKPAGLNALALATLRSRALSKGARIQVGFNFRYCFGIKQLRLAVPASLLYLQGTFLSKHPVATGFGYPESIVHWLKTNGIHLIDLLESLDVQMQITKVRPQNNGEDRFLLQVDGIAGASHVSLLMGNMATRFTMQLMAVGQDGTVYRMFDPAERERVAGLAKSCPYSAGGERLVQLGYDDELAIFLDGPMLEKPVPATLEDAIRAIEVVDNIVSLLDHD